MAIIPTPGAGPGTATGTSQLSNVNGYPGGQQVPMAGQQPTGINPQIQQFIQYLQSQQPFFTQAADQLLQQSQGIDPLMEQYRQAQVGALQGQLSRRGITGSAGINEVNRLNNQFTTMGLERSDQALQNSLGARSTAITQAGFPAALITANTAAQNAGEGGGSGGGGLCCFIVLEATDGILPDVIRRYRDEQCTPRKRRGYYRLAEVLVPAMRRWKWAKSAIRWLMVKPLTAYGRWYYGESKWGFLASPVKWVWLGLFALLGWGKFHRKNGEII